MQPKTGDGYNLLRRIEWKEDKTDNKPELAAMTEVIEDLDESCFLL